MPLKQMKSVNRTKSAEFREEVDNNIEQKSLSRLSDKPDPDVPGTTIEGNDSTSVVKKITQDQEKTKCDSEYKTVHLQPPCEDSDEERWVRQVATQYSYLNQYLRERSKEMMREGIESSDSDTSDEEPLPNTSGGRTHSMQKMTEEKKKCDGIDARVHSRIPLVRRKEDVKEQADWHHTQLNEAFRNYIKELIKEELATGYAKMRKLLIKDLEEIRGTLKKELRQIFVEKTALLQEQEHWNLQYLQLKELFRRDLKEMVRQQVKNSKIIICPKEEPLPGASKGTADYQRTSLEQRKKKKHGGDHDSAPSHSEKPSVQTEEEVIDGQSDSRCMPLKELIKDDLKEALCETLEKYKCDTCMKKELPHILHGRKQLRKISTGQELRKKYDSEFLYSEQPATKRVKEMEHEHSELQHVHLKELIKKDLKVKICDVLGKYKNVCPEKEGLPRVSMGKTRLKKITEEQEKEKCNAEYASLWERPSVKTDEVTIDQQNSLQYKHLKAYIRENVKEMVHDQLENADLIIHLKEEPAPDDSRREISTKVKEKKSGYLYVPHFNPFEHRIAALRATAHVEPAPAACPGDAGDLGDMDNAFKAQLACPVALAASTEHQRWQPHTDPELAPGHRPGDTRDPPHNADLALDKLSIDLESATLCGPSDTKDTANDADLAFHTAHPTGHFRPSRSTNNRLSDKPDPDVPGTTIEDNDSTSVVKKMTEEKKKCDGIDARVHSRIPLVRRKEDVKEQADWHHTQLNEALRNYIKELIKEELATGYAKMRKLLIKDLEEIRGTLKKELRQVFVEKTALLQEQEHWNLQYLQLKELFRRDLKEMVRQQVKNSKITICPKEEPLPGASKGTADYQETKQMNLLSLLLQRTSLEQRKKKKHGGDHDSAPSHSEKPSVQTEEEVIDGQSDSRCMPLKELIKHDLKEALCEILEKYKCDTCMKKELPHILHGRKQLRKISTGQELRKKYDSEFLYSEQPATKRVKEMEHEHSELQHVHLKELIKKDLKYISCEGKDASASPSPQCCSPESRTPALYRSPNSFTPSAPDASFYLIFKGLSENKLDRDYNNRH
ncbi:uncharacterized protein LOC128119341 [Peromyscus californicus insignis]|uniref:uncharacterized protein LOC128119341 n=1 Tax=Peromyscus californicus insignis TaxID=564181 RepID=UPI0022A6CE01|nr:uncharacterized protein LOC128119341 [Peromyscus californicus insignis]